ncbi:MAG: hypothetical protein WD333_06020 [Dehalococcoidia bacterium]
MATKLNNENSLAARLRRELRNPSMPMAILMLVVVIAIPSAIFGPGIVRQGIDGYQEKERLSERGSGGDVTTASWINPWLKNQTDRMISAERPVEWRGVSFQTGPCNPINLSQLPPGKYAEAVAAACHDLDDIQLRYAGDCATTNECNIPPAAQDELRAVINRLFTEFGDAGDVTPYNTGEQETGPS